VSDYRIHTIETAPEAAKPSLEQLVTNLGMIPNLAGTMAESPELLRGFLSIRDILYRGTFTAAEVQVLALTNAFENRCSYCMAFHSNLALKSGVSEQTVVALRAGQSPTEPRLEALSNFSRRMVRERGSVRRDDLAAFHSAGYTKAQALEVVLGVAVSILPNFAHHITDCPVDEAFAGHSWVELAETTS
jgi:AhpD family alkylhydroperoxidase